MGGRDEAFREFYDPALVVLRRLAFRLTGNVPDAEDLAQETMVRVYQKWRALAASPDPLMYARTVMLNRHRSLLRRARHERVHRTEPEFPRELSARDADLWRELQRLQIKQRQALVLHFYEDMPQTEIAELLGCASGTVNSLVHRGLERLRARMTEDVARSEPT